jgi:hypothetical protein
MAQKIAQKIAHEKIDNQKSPRQTRPALVA